MFFLRTIADVQQRGHIAALVVDGPAGSLHHSQPFRRQIRVQNISNGGSVPTNSLAFLAAGFCAQQLADNLALPDWVADTYVVGSIVADTPDIPVCQRTGITYDAAEIAKAQNCRLMCFASQRAYADLVLPPEQIIEIPDSDLEAMAAVMCTPSITPKRIVVPEALTANDTWDSALWPAGYREFLEVAIAGRHNSYINNVPCSAQTFLAIQDVFALPTQEQAQDLRYRIECQQQPPKRFPYPEVRIALEGLRSGSLHGITILTDPIRELNQEWYDTVRKLHTTVFAFAYRSLHVNAADMHIGATPTTLLCLDSTREPSRVLPHQHMYTSIQMWLDLPTAPSVACEKGFSASEVKERIEIATHRQFSRSNQYNGHFVRDSTTSTRNTYTHAVARTIADLENVNEVTAEHVAKATVWIQYI